MSSDRTDTARQSDVGSEGRKEETVREAPSGKVPPDRRNVTTPVLCLPSLVVTMTRRGDL